jgi:hypothetical protein
MHTLHGAVLRLCASAIPWMVVAQMLARETQALMHAKYMPFAPAKALMMFAS